MLRLFIDTGNPVSNLALFHENKLLGSKQNELQQDHGKTINPLLDDLCKKSGVTFHQLHAVWVVTGPGSYTGLRIAMATAKGIAYALHIPLFGLSMFDWLASAVKNRFAIQEFGMLSIARAGEYFVSIQSDLPTLQLQPCLMLEKDLTELMQKHALPWFSYQNLAHDFVLEVNTVIPELTHLTDLFFAENQNSFALDLMLSEPLYLKNVHINKINNL